MHNRTGERARGFSRGACYCGLVQLAAVPRIADSIPVVVDDAAILQQESKHVYLANVSATQNKHCNLRRDVKAYLDIIPPEHLLCPFPAL